MSGVRAIVWGQFRSIVRRPVNLIFTIVLPLAMAVVFGGIYQSGDGGHATIGLVPEGDGVVTELLVAEFEAGTATTVTFEDRDAAERAVRRREIDAAVVIPTTVDDPTQSPSQLELVGPPGVAQPGGLRTLVHLAVARVGSNLVVAEREAPDDPLGGGLEIARQRADEAGIDRSPLDDTDRETAANARALFGMLVLFTFMNVLAGAGDLASMREAGLLSRLRATSIGDSRIVAGFVGWLALYGSVQAGTIAVGGTVLLGIRWDSPLALIVTVITIGLAAGALSALFSLFLPPYPIGTSVAGGIGFVLGLLGGCLWTLDIVNPTLAAIGRLTPQAWAMEALEATTARGDTGDWVRSILVLVAFTLVAGAIATSLIRRRVATTT